MKRRLINRLIKDAVKVSEEYPLATNESGRIRSVEFLDYGTFPLTTEDIDNIIEILETSSNTSHGVANYVGTTHQMSVAKAMNALAQEIKKKIYSKYTLLEQVTLNKAMNVDSMLYDFVSDTFSIDIDTSEVIRTILDYQNPYSLYTVIDEIKDSKGNWIQEGETYYRPLSKETHNALFDELCADPSHYYVHFDFDNYKVIYTDKSKNHRTIHHLNLNLEEYIARAKWLGSVCTNLNDLRG